MRWYWTVCYVLVGVFGTISLFVHPRAPALVEAVDPMSVKIQDIPNLESVTWVDARSQKKYDESHIENAVWVSEDDWEAGMDSFFPVWHPDHLVIVYCDGGACKASQSVTSRLREELGVDNVYYLYGGYKEWHKQGQE